ncbi:MAG: hypothetical protein AAGG81_00700 [Chlamydiota bacterium]
MIGINFLNSRQSAEKFHMGMSNLYDGIIQFVKWDAALFIRVSSSSIALTSSVLKVSMRICSVVETIIKGLANILAFAYTDRCEFFAGVNQLFVKLLMDVLALLLTPAEVCVGTIVTTGGILLNPKKYAEDRRSVHLKSMEAFEESRDVNNISIYSSAATILFT